MTYQKNQRLYRWNLQKQLCFEECAITLSNFVGRDRALFASHAKCLRAFVQECFIRKPVSLRNLTSLKRNQCMLPSTYDLSAVTLASGRPRQISLRGGMPAEIICQPSDMLNPKG
ncbi:hypothetical protein T265_11218 [Opisthorchis viverrini]|uniref:Uncharacterized protein n=1 Tax=Opisthorchis viverrini TaxID=6198 RepID=A0A074YZJ9_OPIVI|nr:hypothetical protein T265_11218 [Opisthorchis viverrini]KER20181.1 hypothetical protein T265_11218 [Opisthorchis viverrini]